MNCHTRFPCVSQDILSAIASKLLSAHIELSLMNCHTRFPCVSQDIISAIVSSCAHFFSMMLPSSSLLILDFIQATNGVIFSQNMEVIHFSNSLIIHQVKTKKKTHNREGGLDTQS